MVQPLPLASFFSLVLTALLCGGLQGGAHGTDYFTSTAHVNELLASRGRLADALNRYVEKEAKRLDGLRRLAREMGAAAGLEQGDNPIAAYLAIRQLGQDLDTLLGAGPDARMVKSAAGLALPKADDLDGAGDALARLQNVYSISAESISRGQLVIGSSEGIIEVDATAPLVFTVNDCLHMASRAFNSSLDHIGFDWVRLTLSGLFNDDVLRTLLPTALNMLERKFMLTTEYQRLGKALASMWYQYKPVMADIGSMIQTATEYVYNLENQMKDDARYQKLCRDGQLTEEAAPSTLTCRHSVPHPYFTLAPVREELLSAEPRVVFIHDLLTDRESSRLIEISQPRLLRAGVVGEPITRVRISKNVFLHDNFDWSVTQTNRKVGMATGLDVADSDILQMNNYGIGGQYEPHVDCFHAGEIAKVNDRIATVLLYLNKVKQGGGTVFTRLGMRVMPERNGALFWYNLRRNASVIYDTTHAACPVLEGSKWVANKWIYYWGQMRNRPCSLSRLE